MIFKSGIHEKKDDISDLHIGLFTMYIIDYGWLYDYRLTYSLNPRRKHAAHVHGASPIMIPGYFSPEYKKEGAKRLPDILLIISLWSFM